MLFATATADVPGALVRLGGRIWLKYESGDRSFAESFTSGLAAIKRAALVQNFGATGLSIDNAQGETILGAAEIALAVKSLGDVSGL